jgi:hypothetical protein
MIILTPAPLIFVFFMLLSLLAGWILWRAVAAIVPKLASSKVGVCVWCGYNRAGIGHDALCPQCGRALGSAHMFRAGPILAWAAACLLSSAGAWAVLVEQPPTLRQGLSITLGFFLLFSLPFLPWMIYVVRCSWTRRVSPSHLVALGVAQCVGVVGVSLVTYLRFMPPRESVLRFSMVIGLGTLAGTILCVVVAVFLRVMQQHRSRTLGSDDQMRA